MEINLENKKGDGLRRKFITNIIFGQKLINCLSVEKKNKVSIDYFLNHIENFKKQKNERWEEKIDHSKYINLIPEDINLKLVDNTDIIIKNNYHIEPYCKKSLKLITPMGIFGKTSFHYKLVRLESKYYDLFGILYYGENIVGYICCGKRNSTSYKNLYIVLVKEYGRNFYDKMDKKLVIINDITEDISFYEKEVYQDYLRHFRSSLFSMVYEILGENKAIKNVVCIGEEEGGNLLQLFTVDFFNNKNDCNLKLNDISFHLFTLNTAMLSTDTFYKDFVELLGENSVITCFSRKNSAYESWNENKRMNLIFS